jgi:hypothetical protein
MEGMAVAAGTGRTTTKIQEGATCFRTSECYNRSRDTETRGAA